tara:strand:+ start:3313 stop:3789 length:477 start_codon:yes stop_codon:yes gene_type:complete
MPQVIELKIAGNSEREIAAELGVTQGTINKDVKDYLGKLADEHRAEAEELRGLYTARYERMLLTIWPQVLAGDLEAVQQANRLLISLARIWGIIAKEPVVTVLREGRDGDGVMYREIGTNTDLGEVLAALRDSGYARIVDAEPGGDPENGVGPALHPA